MRNLSRDVNHSSLGSFKPAPRGLLLAFSTSGATSRRAQISVISVLVWAACDVRERRANRRAGDYTWQLARMRQVISGAGVPSVVSSGTRVPGGLGIPRLGGGRRGDHGGPGM